MSEQSTELVRTQQSSLAEKMQWAKAMATATMLPRQYQANPGNLLYALEYADALGVSRISAITSIYVIDGKPSASADLIAGMVRRAGHKLRVSGDDTYSEAVLIRADDPEFSYRARWDLDKARAAGLLNKGVWKSYPAAMLRARAITEVARAGASDALFGCIYTPEELGAEIDGDGDVIKATATVVTPEQPPTPEAVDEPTETGLLLDTGSALAKAMYAGINEIKIGEDDRIPFICDTIGRQITSTKEMTENEARAMLREIDRIKALEVEDAATPETLDAEVIEGGDQS